ncbi:MAG: hypothetical protein DCC75_06475 [Proteobacteria bacterium]|nr:MAG: hypothetical protein DCC75_06475 [Pseudomonadota bacterium]
MSRREFRPADGALSALIPAQSAIVWILSLFFLASSAFSEAKPKLSVAESVFDFGTVTQGTKVKHDFVVKNSGDADLIIQRVVAACGCTAVSASNEPIAAGKDTVIHVEFDTGGFSGEKLKTVRVFSNDSENPSQLLTLKGTIEADLTVEPRSVFFEELLKNAAEQERTQIVELRTRRGSKAKIDTVKSFSKYVAVKELEGGETYRKLAVTIDPSAPVGELRDRLIVGLSSSRENSVNIPVFAVIKGQLALRPNQLSFGVIEGSKKLTRTANLEVLGKNTVGILKVKTNDPAVSAIYKQVQAGRKYVLEVTIDPQLVKRDLRTSVEILTDSKEEESVSLNVYGISPPKL